MTLQRKILLTLFTIAVVPMAIVGVILYKHEVDAAMRSQDSALTGLAKSIAGEVDAGVEHQLEIARANAMLPMMSEYIAVRPDDRAASERACNRAERSSHRRPIFRGACSSGNRKPRSRRR